MIILHTYLSVAATAFVLPPTVPPAASTGDLLAIRANTVESISDGTLTHAVILVESGKFATVGEDLTVERGIPTLDLPDDWVVVPGQPQASELFKRISLPAGHEDIMPSKDSPLNTAEIAMVEAWIKDNMSTKALIDSAGMVEKGGRVDPRTWAAAYLSLDLTATQRNDATKTMQTLMSKMREQRAARQGQGRPQNRGDAQPDSPATKPAGDTPPNDRSNRQGMQDVQKKIGQEQSRLWEALSRKQQEAMRALLDDPEAIKKLRRANRGVRRGPDSGARRPGRPSGTGDQPRD